MLQPLDKRILIAPITPEPKKTNILLLKDDAPQTWGVVAIGDEVKKVNIGDIILIAAHSTSEVNFEGIKYTMIHESNIIAKVV